MRTDLFTNGHVGFASKGQVDIDSRAKSNESVARTPPQRVTRLNVTENTPGHETRDLNHSGSSSAVVLQNNGVSLILNRCLVNGRVEKLSGVIHDLKYPTSNRGAIGVHIEHIHKDTDLQAGFPRKRIRRCANEDNSTVGWAGNGLGVQGALPRRVPKKLQNKNGEQPKKHGYETTQPEGCPNR
jgi:hypothetical protein